MNELTGIPTVVLEKELQRRADDEAKARSALMEDRARAVTAVLRGAGVVDALAPEHDRTSCSDERTSNGYGSEDNLPRCRRCQLLQAASRESWPAYLKLEVTIGHWR